jgi:general secretion pathway protein G
VRRELRITLRGGGFSLVELMAVLAILAVLAATAMPLAELSWQRERERELKRALWEIRDAIDAHKRAADAGVIERVGDGYPVTLEVLVAGAPTTGVRSGDRKYFLRRLPRDPFAPDGVPAEKSWGLRSSASPPERPAAGADVFDVYSTSTAIGLNGIALRAW